MTCNQTSCRHRTFEGLKDAEKILNSLCQKVRKASLNSQFRCQDPNEAVKETKLAKRHFRTNCSFFQVMSDFAHMKEKTRIPDEGDLFRPSSISRQLVRAFGEFQVCFIVDLLFTTVWDMSYESLTVGCGVCGKKRGGNVEVGKLVSDVFTPYSTLPLCTDLRDRHWGFACRTWGSISEVTWKMTSICWWFEQRDCLPT